MCVCVQVTSQSELAARKEAEAKSTTARDKSRTESELGGKDAGKMWAERKKNLLACDPYYKSYQFEERFITVELDEMKKPSAAALAEVEQGLQCVSPRAPKHIAHRRKLR